MENLIYYAIIVIVIGSFLWSLFLDYLNATQWKLPLPSELQGAISEEKYKSSINYQRAKMKIGVFTAVVSLVFMLLLLQFNGFAYIWFKAKEFTSNPLLLNLGVIGFFFLIQSVVSLPVSYYSTFSIEQRFGFNRSTKTLFFTDFIKGLFLGVLIGAPVLGSIIWVYTLVPNYFWLIALGIVAFFMLFFTFFYTTLIVPIFNKLTPLPEGELRTMIDDFAQKAGVEIGSVSVIDGSKRSSKANAYFSGFGKKKRIVLYDTLMNQLSNDEVVAVLAHEVGHYKKHHVIKGMVFGLVNAAALFYIFSLFVGNEVFMRAVAINESSFAVGLIIFTILFEPVSAVIGLIQTILSRKNEYEADAFANHYGFGQQLISALKKLHIENFSNLNPHPLVVFFEYSHPPLVQRIKAILMRNK